MQSRQSQAAPRTCTLFFLPLLTLAFPLGVLLVVLQRLPAEEVRLASTDSRLLQPVSTFWCSAQEVSSNHPFYAYKVPRVPPVLRDPAHQHLLAFRFNLLVGTHYMLRYHLLAGSTLELAGCTNSSPAPFDIFYGKEAWDDCLEVMTETLKENGLSSEEDSDEDLSESIEHIRLARGTNNDIVSDRMRYETRQGSHGHLASRPKKGRKLHCDNSLLSGQLERAQTEENPSPSCPVDQYAFALTAARTGKYYVVVRTDGLNEPGGSLLHVRMNRTSYELPDSVLFCRSPHSCAIPLTFGAEERVVVFVSAEPDAGKPLFQVRSTCQPRAAFYLVVFLLLPVLFALALLYLVRFQRRRRRCVPHATTGQRSAAAVEVAAEVATKDESERLSDSRPPSYRDVVLEPRATPETTPPPSYEELLRQPLVSVHRF